MLRFVCCRTFVNYFPAFFHPKEPVVCLYRTYSMSMIFTAFNPLTNMKLISILLVFLACNTASRPADQATTSLDTPTVEMFSDSIVPPQYDAQGKLVKVTKTKEEWKKQLGSEA